MAAKHYGTFTILDYSEEKSPVSFSFGGVTALNIAGFLTQFGALRTALTAIITGVVQKEKWVGDDTVLSNTPPTDQNAQIELKWLLTYEAQLKQAVIDKPQAYTYGLDEVPGVVAKMAAAFERDSYNKDGEAIKRTCKALGISYTRTGINAYLNALEPHEEAHVGVVMDIPMSLTKGRDGWEALSWVHIPGQPEASVSEDTEPTHIRVSTGKASRGGIFCHASAVTKTAFGFAAIMDFHDPEPWERLGESPDRCTEKSVAILHRVSLSRLKELRPELFPTKLEQAVTNFEAHVASTQVQAQEAPMPDALGLATDPDEWTEFAPSGKEPCATGVDEDEDEDDTRFLRPVPGGGVHLRA